MRLPVLLAALLLAGCAAQCPPPPPPVTTTRLIDTACNWVRLITGSPLDTLETKRQILAHDTAFTKNCGHAAAVEP